ncbi:unnamed protein product [Larinioides sclopetarius]|uniref:Cytochrome P450 n=1 Tax=Larinioides sclopetarius TaxID=280406 RepID=A0AAV1ZU80_9ARAC
MAGNLQSELRTFGVVIVVPSLSFKKEGKPWSEQRKFFLQTSKNFGFGKQEFELQIQDEIKTLLQELRKFDDEPSSLYFNLAYTFNTIISKVLFNMKFDKDVTFKRNLSSMNEIVRLFTGTLNMLIGMPFYLFLYIIGSRKMPKGKKDVLKFIGKVVDEIRQNYDPSHPKCYVDAYLQQQDELRKKGKLQESSFTEHRLKANAFNLFFEGTESVTSTIGSLLVELSKHPDVQKKIQEELDNVVGRERLPSWTDKQNLPYLDATIQELSRMAALFLVSIMHSNFKETTIESYRIPERSIIIANLYSIHFDPKLFPNPDKFDPGRFLDNEGRRIKVEGGPYLFGLGITQEEGQTWNEQRRFFLQTAKNFGFGKQEFEHHIHDEIKVLLQELRNFDGKPNDLRFHLAYTFNSIISKVLFNKKFEKDTSLKRNLNSLNQMVQIFTGVLHMLIGYPYYIALEILGDKDILKGKKEVQTFIAEVVDEVKENYDPNNPKSYIDSYLQQMEELKKKGKLQESSFTDQRLKANALNLFLEGTESVSSTVANLLLELSKHPDVQRKIQEELDSVVGRERLPSWTDKQNLPYLDATIQELSRTSALFLVTTMYSNFKETTIEGYRIPERSVIVSNLYSIHFDPELFPNPEKFDPGRFLNSEGKRVKLEGGPYLYGLGKRSCIGESLAQVEIFLLIGSLLQSFTVPYAKDIGSLRVVPRE